MRVYYNFENDVLCVFILAGWLVKSVNDNGNIRDFTVIPVCQKPAEGFSAKKVFYKHIREEWCSEKDIKDFVGVDLEERRTAKVKVNKEKNVKAGGPDVDPVGADSLPSYYAGYPEKPLNSTKIATIMVKLAGDATEQDHARIGQESRVAAEQHPDRGVHGGVQ